MIFGGATIATIFIALPLAAAAAFAASDDKPGPCTAETTEVRQTAARHTGNWMAHFDPIQPLLVLIIQVPSFSYTVQVLCRSVGPHTGIATSRVPLM
jgi:hypothetical protein